MDRNLVIQPFPILVGAGGALVAQAIFDVVQDGLDALFFHRLFAAALLIGGVTIFVCIPMTALMTRVLRLGAGLSLCALPMILGLLSTASFLVVTRSIEYVEVSGVMVKARSEVTPDGWIYLINLSVQVAVCCAAGVALFWVASRVKRD